MKKSKFIRRVLSALLAGGILITTISASASETDVAVIDGRLTAETAQCIAEYFVRDAGALEDISWTEETVVSKVVPMYDVDGKVSAYSFELTTDCQENGYIVISAYDGAQEFILEYADKARPSYGEFISPRSAAEEKVVYTGPFGYYKELDSGEYLSSSGQTFSKEVVSEEQQALEPQFVPYGGIVDHVAYANSHYQGPFVSNGDWVNDFEDYCYFLILSDFRETYINTCVPLAVTNMLVMRGDYENKYSITRYTPQEIYTNGLSYGLATDSTVNPGLTLYVRNIGVDPGDVPTYVKGAVRRIVSNAAYTKKTATFANIKSELTARRPFVLEMFKNATDSGYPKHAVAAYAYNRLVSSTTGAYKSFVKVADGEVTAGRYIDIATIQSSSMAVMHCVSW